MVVEHHLQFRVADHISRVEGNPGPVSALGISKSALNVGGSPGHVTTTTHKVSDPVRARMGEVLEFMRYPSQSARDPGVWEGRPKMKRQTVRHEIRELCSARQLNANKVMLRRKT